MPVLLDQKIETPPASLTRRNGILLFPSTRSVGGEINTGVHIRIGLGRIESGEFREEDSSAVGSLGAGDYTGQAHETDVLFHFCRFVFSLVDRGSSQQI